ncbi:thiopurine S-methyltransferase [Spirosoma sp. KNUC1025]|uniref:thiopurine S-methyltransferase n=1 Tax=Spirosoma sp. KNUC1025 TaxID=2894082 RepID=UPI00386AFAE3|nr:thiopurine S-methyltransferase [Spirosoma sp. KNUC1025]
MEEIFWFNSWELNRNYAGFRRQDIHPYAVKHLSPFSLEGKSVFMPLCGKSFDLLYFSEFAHRVIGVEIEEKTILQFFDENERLYKRIGNRFISGNLTLICCDIFSLKPADLGLIDIVYDRGALAEFPPILRMKYRQVLERLIPVGALNFLNTLDDTLHKAQDSLRSVTQDEVASYYPNYAIDHVEKPGLGSHDAHRNRSHPLEHAFLMHKLYELC